MPPNLEADPVAFVAFASRRYRLAIELDVGDSCFVLERPSGRTISVHVQGDSEESRIRAGLRYLARAGGETPDSLLAGTGSVMLSSGEVRRLLQAEPDTLTGLITDPEHLHRLMQESRIDPWTVPIWLPDPLAGWAGGGGVGGGRPGSASMEAEQAREATRQLLAHGCESVAVVLPCSSIDAHGELWLQDVVARMNDRVPVSLSHRAASFRAGLPRVLATLIDARVGARVRQHLQRIRQILQSLGFSGDILIAQSSGCLASIDRVVRAPASTAGSVTAMGLLRSSLCACHATHLPYGDGIHPGVLDQAVTTLATRAVSDLAADGGAGEDTRVVMEFSAPGAGSPRVIRAITWQPPSRRLSALDDFVAAVHQASGRAPGRPEGTGPGFAGVLRVSARAAWGSEEEIDPGALVADCC